MTGSRAALPPIPGLAGSRPWTSRDATSSKEVPGRLAVVAVGSAVIGIFVGVVTATHDVVHRTLGLSARATDVWLFLLGLVLLESGHAYRMTHRQHHRP